MNNLQFWLHYLENLHPRSIDLGLDRIKPVALALGLMPLLNSKRLSPTIITVTGTNGKGTCVTSLASIYHCAGYKVGAYTSPHLWEFTERIQINTEQVSETLLCQAFAEVEKARANISLTYFEFTTLAALWIFQQHALDILILEVGMGGRLDAVNIVDADLAVITTVDLDHQAWLGETREQIAFEKAGIFRAERPVVCGKDMPGIIESIAQQLKSPIYILDKDFFSKTLFKTHLLMDNIALSLQVIELLQAKHPVTLPEIEQGISQCRLPGRQQLVEKPLWQLFDVAHNSQSVRALAQRLAAEKTTQRTFAVFSMLRDKDLAASLLAILPYIHEWHVAGLAVDRGMSTTEIAAAVRQLTTNPVYDYQNIQQAYQSACQMAETENARVVVFGSFHTVAEVRTKK